MQVSSIQGNSFQGVYKANNFNPTPHQKEMIKTIKDKFVNDTKIYRKGKNFHDFMQSKGLNFILTYGDYKDEIKVVIADGTSPQQNCGSFPENRLDDVVNQTKEKWKEHTINNAMFIALGIAGICAIFFLGRK